MSWASSPAARPAPLVPAHGSTSDRILFCVLRLLPFRPRRAPPCPPRRAAPRPCALTGDGSRTVKTRSVPIVSQATPLSLCPAANNAHPMLHQIASSCPPCHLVSSRARALAHHGVAHAFGNINDERHQQNERSQSFRTRRTRRTLDINSRGARRSLSTHGTVCTALPTGRRGCGH